MSPAPSRPSRRRSGYMSSCAAAPGPAGLLRGGAGPVAQHRAQVAQLRRLSRRLGPGMDEAPLGYPSRLCRISSGVGKTTRTWASHARALLEAWSAPNSVCRSHASVRPSVAMLETCTTTSGRTPIRTGTRRRTCLSRAQPHRGVSPPLPSAGWRPGTDATRAPRTAEKSYPASSSTKGWQTLACRLYSAR